MIYQIIVFLYIIDIILKSDNLSCVIIHKGYQPYLKYNLEITSKNNNIYLIGDESVQFLEKINSNITFINISKYENINKLTLYKDKFKNYSTKSFDFEWFCFARVFILQEFLKDFNLNEVFYIDSDNVLLVDIRKLKFKKNCAYLIPNNQENFRMAASIHSGLIDKSFCFEFEKIFNEIYISKEKHSLILPKIDYHQKFDIPGGICDMTLYYLLYSENYINPQNLLEDTTINDKSDFIFMNNLNSSEGLNSYDCYELKNNKIKIFDGNKINDISRNKMLNLCNIHFQGSAKKNLNKFTKFKLNY